MKRTIVNLKTAALAVWSKACHALLALSVMLVARPALAAAAGLTPQDLTTDQAAGKKFDAVANNINTASTTGAALLIQLVSVGGFVVVAVSLYQLYKASKDEREKPLSAIVGLFIGGAMAAVGTIMWVMRNTVVG